MREICLDQIARSVPHRQLRILDIGCGTGANLEAMKQFGSVKGVDQHPRCIEWCLLKGLDVSSADMLALELPPSSFDLVTMFDVLNQAPLEKMASVLRSIHLGLAPEGYLAIREPALSVASGPHDIKVGIRARLNRRQMNSLLTQSGFHILTSTYLNTLLFPPIVAMRKIQKLFGSEPKSDVRATEEPWNTLLLGVLQIERELVKVMSLPYGVSLFTIARKA
jgi:SAM-dependent methyltransferase